MKKILFTCLMAAASGLFFGQSVYADNFDALTIGNVGTDITGATPGQGGWYTIAATTAANSAASNFQIVANNATHGKVLSILGSAGTTGTKQVNQNSKLVSVWGSRTAGNNVLQYEFDIFSGAATSSQNTGRIYLWDSVANKCLIGFSFNMTSKQHTLVAYSNPADVNGQAGNDDGNWGYTFNQALNANTWYKVGLAWDSVSGEISYKIIDESTGLVVLDEIYQGKGMGATPDLANIQVLAVPNSTVTSNTVAVNVLFDNIKLKATEMVDLLAVNDVTNSKLKVSMYPNPTSDFIKFDTSAKIDAVELYDLSGKSVDVQLKNNEVDVRKLQKGVYLVKVKMNDGSTSTNKIIKE